MRIHSMWENFPELQNELVDVLELIDTNIRVRDKTIEKIVKDLVHSGGKMLRPAYSLLCSSIGPEQDKEKAIAIAAAIECLHMATLVHDDVIDEAETRHGIATIHSFKGNKYAIYAGDYLFSLTFNLLSKHANSLADLEFNAKGMEKILIGELEQLNSRYIEPNSVKDYLSRISGKTAQLFAVSCYSGAVISKASRKMAINARNMGHYLGMAFQIIDDILDYKSDNKTLGKPVMHDIQQGIYTLPFIYATKENRTAFKPYIEKRDKLTNNDLTSIFNLIKEYQGIEKSFDLAKKYTKKALNELEKLPQGEYKTTLRNLTNYLLNRKM
ncbi:polyprenyl synthetase family protein [Bacillus andreraoultii]|uniref:polyprenyl synthetase family protein n=1 Tax=Bacillus andreraoultii TaxID=1499685 RepID=UPI00053B6CBD|nr:polyprenyl synthetase family protein [Bacillus andreraoultii]